MSSRKSRRNQDEGILVTLVSKLLEQPFLFFGVAATGVVIGMGAMAVLFLIFMALGLGNSAVGLIGMAVGLAVAFVAWGRLWEESRPAGPVMEGIDDCKAKTEFNSMMICLTMKIDAILKRAYLVEGRGTNELLDAAIEKGLKITEYEEKRLRRVISVRNRSVHEPDYDPGDIRFSDMLTQTGDVLAGLKRRNDALSFIKLNREGGKLRFAMNAVGTFAMAGSVIYFMI